MAGISSCVMPSSCVRKRAGAACLALLLLLVCTPVAAEDRAFDWNAGRQLYPGIRHTREVVDSPRKMIVNCLQIDTRTPGLKFSASPRRAEWIEGRSETNRQTVRNFIRTARREKKHILVAVNADGFSPWPAPFDREEPTDIAGLAVSGGVLVSRPNGSPSFVVRKSGAVQIQTIDSQQDLSDIETAVSGFGLVLVDGVVLDGGDDLHPRTGLGLSEDTRQVQLLTIDGRQPDSEGGTTQDVGRLLKRFGSYTGINMDGGGSSTMAWWDSAAPGDDKCRLLNTPVGSGKTYNPATAAAPFAATERANGNNLGVSGAAE